MQKFYFRYDSMVRTFDFQYFWLMSPFKLRPLNHNHIQMCHAFTMPYIPTILLCNLRPVRVSLTFPCLFIQTLLNIISVSHIVISFFFVPHLIPFHSIPIHLISIVSTFPLSIFVVALQYNITSFLLFSSFFFPFSLQFITPITFDCEVIRLQLISCKWWRLPLRNSNIYFLECERMNGWAWLLSNVRCTAYTKLGIWDRDGEREREWAHDCEWWLHVLIIKIYVYYT